MWQFSTRGFLLPQCEEKRREIKKESVCPCLVSIINFYLRLGESVKQTWTCNDQRLCCSYKHIEEKKGSHTSRLQQACSQSLKEYVTVEMKKTIYDKDNDMASPFKCSHRPSFLHPCNWSPSIIDGKKNRADSCRRK